ncbi:MAG: hypothetical protein AVW06_02325 [Hadesarchaea archaeon DG-33-1]|nr:MAG: hypothetical protein AVW06_02325 [Hadesarchaea archaeon DG-33-1]
MKLEANDSRLSGYTRTPRSETMYFSAGSVFLTPRTPPRAATTGLVPGTGAEIGTHSGGSKKVVNVMGENKMGAKWTTVGYIRKTRKGNAVAVTSGKTRIGVVSLAALADLLSDRKNYATIVTAPADD